MNIEINLPENVSNVAGSIERGEAFIHANKLFFRDTTKGSDLSEYVSCLTFSRNKLQECSVARDAIVTPVKTLILDVKVDKFE